MAKVVDGKRRIIRLSADDVLNIVRQYQCLTYKSCCYEHTRELLDRNPVFIPEDLD